MVATAQASITESKPPKSLMGPSQNFFSPTLGLFLLSMLLPLVGMFGLYQVHWNPWLSFTTGFIAVWLLNVVLHDSSHRSAHRWSWLNDFLGFWAALLQGLTWPVFLRTHLAHHAHTNDPEKDPDYYVSTGGPLWLTPIRFFHQEWFFFRHRLYKGWQDLGLWALSRGIQVGLLVLAWHLGYFKYVMDHWFVPAGWVALGLGIWLDYFPHRPFDSLGRFGSTRVYPSRWLNRLIFGQNYHLVHHLWPSVPWYHYQDAYYATKELLLEKKSPHGLGLSNTREWLMFLRDFFVGVPKNRSHR